MRPTSFRVTSQPTFLLGLSWLLAGAQGFAADVKTYVIEKGIQYVQSDAGPPSIDANNGAIFAATVKATDSNLVTSASMTLPNGSTDSLPQDASDEFKLKKKYNKQSTLDANFPSGTYALAVTTARDGTKALALPLRGDTYPNTPHLLNFSGTQVIDAGAYFLFTWDPFDAGSADDFVQLHIEDNQGNKVWETPDVGETGALDGRATSALVPPRSLTAGQGYQALVYFAKAVGHDLATYPGAVGFSGYYKRTKLAIQTTANASGADVKLYGVSKSRRFQQNDSGPPVPQITKTFDFELFVATETAGFVSAVSVGLPSGIQEPLELQSDNKTFDFTDNAVSQSGLDALYADGLFQFQIQTAHAGTRSSTLALAGDAYPAAPHLLTSIPSSVDASADWVVSWDPFVGGTESDFVQLHIEDDQGNKVFETPNYGKSSALSGDALSALVPRDSLPTGKSLNARVVFQKNLVLDTTSYPGALGVASYATRTSFSVHTVSTGGPQPVTLAVASVNRLGGFQLLITGNAGQSVRVDTSSNLRQWTSLSTNAIPASGQWQLTDGQALGLNTRFYRAVSLP